MSQVLRSVRLASGLPHDVFQQPANGMSKTFSEGGFRPAFFYFLPTISPRHTIPFIDFHNPIC
jgi:hypothetical protein